MTNSLDSFINQQTNILRELWYSCDAESIPLSQIVSLEKKLKNEENLSAQLRWVNNQLEVANLKEQEQNIKLPEAVVRLKRAGTSILGFTDDQMDCFKSLGITRSAEEFYRQARNFNPFISFEDIYQASRNVWTSNYLQVLLGLPVELTPSLFAYSMLYPVSDNYLDDPNISRAEKLAFNGRFYAWLKGESAVPKNGNEQDVFDLVQMVETQYPRKKFPQVYDSLLAIFAAQDKSMRVPKLSKKINTTDIVEITFEKGGTSVLADGVLAAGELSDKQLEIIFNYGAFAQLMDDQEDLFIDLKERNRTLFTEAAVAGKVDKTMNRVFHFAYQVLKGLDNFENPQAVPLKQMSMKGIDLLLIDAVLRTEKYYSRTYRKELEQYFPFRFDYLKKVRKTIQKKKITAERLIGLFSPTSAQFNLSMIDAF